MATRENFTKSTTTIPNSLQIDKSNGKPLDTISDFMHPYNDQNRKININVKVRQPIRYQSYANRYESYK